MSEDKKTDPSTPPCPLCSSLTRLKELWEEDEHFLKVFRCSECSVLYPVIVKREDGGPVINE
jgi:hypothetical protein